MTRRQKKIRFKRKWLSGHRAPFLRTVPNKWKVSWADKINEIYEETVRKLLKEQRKQREQAQAPGLPWAMKKYIDRYFWQNIADFACSPREFHWRQLRRAAEARRRRAG